MLVRHRSEKRQKTDVNFVGDQRPKPNDFGKEGGRGRRADGVVVVVGSGGGEVCVCVGGGREEGV